VGGPDSPRASLGTVALQWSRLGLTGFGGPPTHVALLRRLCVEQRAWIDGHEFEDAIAATNLLPGPASTQLAIFCAWRVRGVIGGLVGGLCFIAPGLVLIVAMTALLLSHSAPAALAGAAAGAGAGTPAVALRAASGLLGESRRRLAGERAARVRWALYAAAGALGAALAGTFLVAVILGCGLAELLARSSGRTHGAFAALAAKAGGAGLGALSWVALKVGALSFGGGFVIVPLMQHDVVSTYHWMSGTHFLAAVALGQVTPGPVVLTVAAVGYAAAGLAGALVAAAVAFAPSFLFVLGGAGRFGAVRSSATARSFLAGAGPAALGAIAGSAIPLGLALTHLWQVGVLAGVALWLFGARRGVVSALVLAGVAGALVVGLGA
jgi:chromate transporter